jgi:hypothetical protein
MHMNTREMHKFIAYITAISSSVAISACGVEGSASPPTQLTSMFKFTDQRKCEPGSGLSLADMETQLTGAGIPVYALTCGNTGIASIPEAPCGTQNL